MDYKIGLISNLGTSSVLGLLMEHRLEIPAVSALFWKAEAPSMVKAIVWTVILIRITQMICCRYVGRTCKDFFLTPI